MAPLGEQGVLAYDPKIGQLYGNNRWFDKGPDCASPCRGYAAGAMNRRQIWRKVLDREVQRWSAMPCDRLLAELSEEKVYEVEQDSKTYQVEVEILENTATYVHVSVRVDDGSLPASIIPVSQSIICRKP